MKFIKEEISLCKQVAEKHIKKVKYGEWYLLNGKPILCAYANEGFHKSLEAENKIIPLWTISDCLEFLCKEKDYQIEIKRVSNSWFIEIWKIGHKAESIKEWRPTLLEACLKAVLAVLGEEG